MDFCFPVLRVPIELTSDCLRYAPWFPEESESEDPLGHVGCCCKVVSISISSRGGIVVTYSPLRGSRTTPGSTATPIIYVSWASSVCFVVSLALWFLHIEDIAVSDMVADSSIRFHALSPAVVKNEEAATSCSAVVSRNSDHLVYCHDARATDDNSIDNIV